ncbi:velvet factor-domain-containing protein [Talaromyces proteolyticus]|uniref:Velvet factor-domain-containing protein n=1 Tax=Talaromyces proteolyticus TaxID=1131652 RepID=A0AAD4L017_9EURO|nr:velvet factor-domain-containing protein [Talaromyces proteolyticus]KAH8704182.1 velvet factor-domain-containing protein [Talaromyces proteolyticus]
MTPSSQSRQSSRGTRIPLGFERLLHPQNVETEAPQSTSNQFPRDSSGQSSRFRLHIRQQPIATRACAAGEKDRRPIDPPPILQMLLVDFNPESEDDRELIQNSRYTVACLLYAVDKPGPNGEENLIHSSHMPENRKHRENYESRNMTSDNIAGEPPRSVQVLSGKTFVSPFYAPIEPDPETAPGHPVSHNARTVRSMAEISHMPATFFIFADLSVRTAGVYRLKFRLMDWGMTFESGKAQPILSEIFSDPFRVYSSKDFPGMRESSALTWNLRQMGVLELKPREGKGKGKGKAKRKAEDQMIGYE